MRYELPQLLGFDNTPFPAAPIATSQAKLDPIYLKSFAPVF